MEWISDSFERLRRALSPRRQSVVNTTPPVDLLAIGAHPDDVELTCGGTLIKAAKQGYRTGVIDLTGGESGTHGSAELRAREALAAAKVMGVAERVNAGFADAGLTNDEKRR